MLSKQWFVHHREPSLLNSKLSRNEQGIYSLWLAKNWNAHHKKSVWKDSHVSQYKWIKGEFQQQKITEATGSEKAVEETIWLVFVVYQWCSEVTWTDKLFEIFHVIRSWRWFLWNIALHCESNSWSKWSKSFTPMTY